jgi:hypothetical protein
MPRIYRPIELGLLALLSSLLLGSTSAVAQTAPPIHGVNGTMATDSTIKAEHAAGDKIAEGAARVVNGAKKILPGGKGTAQDALDALITGSRVVVREVADGGEAAKTTTEGVVVDVNRSRKQITIRLADKKTQTLRVTDGTTPAGAHVLVSLADQAGAKSYDFRPVS